MDLLAKIFLPLTTKPVYFLLDIFFDVSLDGSKIILPGVCIQIINACVSVSAYYLLIVLNLSTPEINLAKRMYMILFSFLLFLILNIVRIFVLSILAFNNSSVFNLTHEIFLYLVSIIFVVGIWFLTVKSFRIRAIPFYSDLINLYKRT